MLLIQANVLLTTAQLHRTPAERREEQEEGLRTEGRSVEERREEARKTKKKEDAVRVYETEAGKRKKNAIII